MTEFEYEKLINRWRVITASGFAVGGIGMIFTPNFGLGMAAATVFNVIGLCSLLSVALLIVEQVVASLRRRSKGRFSILSLFYVTTCVAVLAAIARNSLVTAVVILVCGFVVFSISLEQKRKSSEVEMPENNDGFRAQRYPNDV